MEKRNYFDQEEIGNVMEKILLISLNREALSIFLPQHLMQVINYKGQHFLCGLTTDGTTLSCRKVSHSWSSSLQNLHFVNICPQ